MQTYGYAPALTCSCATPSTIVATSAVGFALGVAAAADGGGDVPFVSTGLSHATSVSRPKSAVVLASSSQTFLSCGMHGE